MGAFDWLGEAIHWLASWIPQPLVIKANEAGVRHRGGKTLVPVTPGVRWRIKARTKIDTTSTALRTWDIPAQKLTTRDGKAVMIKGVLTGQVEDPMKALVDVFDIDGECVPDRARAGCRPAVTSRDFMELVSGLDDAEHEATIEMRKRLKIFGVAVREFTFTDCVECQVVCYEGSNTIPQSWDDEED